MPSAKYKVDFVGCMKLIRFLASFLFLYAVLSLGVFAQNSEKPNILLILVDDLGYGDLSSYGSEDIESPRIDELMSQGIRFDQFYSDCTVCSPTRASLMTGRYPDIAGVPGVVRQNAPNSWGTSTPRPLRYRTCLSALTKSSHA